MTITSSNRYYICPILLDGALFYILWFSGEPDGVFLDGPRVKIWRSEQSLRNFADRGGFSLSGEVTTPYDLGVVKQIVAGSRPLDVHVALEWWNLFADIARSVHNADFLDHDQCASNTYNQLFCLCRMIPAEGGRPASMTDAETRDLFELLDKGLGMLISQLVQAPTEES